MTHDRDEFARRSKEIYEQRYKALLEATQLYKFVAVEPESEDYFLGESMCEAIQASRDAHPDKLCYVVRVGCKAALELINFMPTADGKSIVHLWGEDRPFTDR